MELILAFIGSLCAAVLYNISKENLIWTGVSGVAGWVAFALLYGITGEIVLSSFSGALVVGIYSESMARVLKSPATIYTIPGIFPLVPGRAAYNTVQLIVENKLIDAADEAVETIVTAMAITFGIMLATAVFRFIRRIKTAKLK